LIRFQITVNRSATRTARPRRRREARAAIQSSALRRGRGASRPGSRHPNDAHDDHQRAALRVLIVVGVGHGTSPKRPDSSSFEPASAWSAALPLRFKSVVDRQNGRSCKVGDNGLFSIELAGIICRPTFALARKQTFNAGGTSFGWWSNSNIRIRVRQALMRMLELKGH